MVNDEYLRTGRRARRADDSGPLKNKRRSRQRKATLKDPVRIPDALEANEKLTTAVQYAVINEVVIEMVEEVTDNGDFEGESDEN